MVVTSDPSISAAITQHELTRRPSRITEQAPQLPLLQPSFAPVRPMRSRRASRRLSRSSARNSVSSPLMVVEITIRSGTLVPPCSFCGFADHPLDVNVGEVFALLDRAPHVVDRPGSRLGGGACFRNCRIAQRLPGQGGVCFRNDEAGWRNGADC